VKILTNCHNLLRNPLHWPICVFRKWIPHRVKVWRGCEYPSQWSSQIRPVWNISLYHGLRPAVPHVRVSARHCHRPLRPSCVTSLPPSVPSRSSPKIAKKKKYILLFWSLGRLVKSR
jgi:hypothetical protein